MTRAIEDKKQAHKAVLVLKDMPGVEVADEGADKFKDYDWKAKKFNPDSERSGLFVIDLIAAPPASLGLFQSPLI